MPNYFELSLFLEVTGELNTVCFLRDICVWVQFQPDKMIWDLESKKMHVQPQMRLQDDVSTTKWVRQKRFLKAASRNM